jgi:hypothetical protein
LTAGERLDRLLPALVGNIGARPGTVRFVRLALSQ